MSIKFDFRFLAPLVVLCMTTACVASAEDIKVSGISQQVDARTALEAATSPTPSIPSTPPNLFTASTTPTSATKSTPATSSAPLDSSALKILAKEIELQKLSVRFMLNTVSKGRWKGWRYFSFQEANAALIESGLITAIDQRSLQIHQNGVANNPHLENSLWPQMIGQSIGVLGDVTELSVNAGHAYRAHQLELDPSTVKRRAIALQGEITKNLTNHKIIPISDMVGASDVNVLEIKQLYQKEIDVLEDIHSLTWMQFSTFSTTLRRLNVTQNAFYALDVVKNATGAAGNGVGLISLHEGRPTLGVSANILTTVSGVLVMTDPISSRAWGKLGAKLHSRGLAFSTEAEREAAYFKLCDDVRIMKGLAAQLDTRCAKELSGLLSRINVYEQHEEEFARYVRNLQEERQKAYTAALSQTEVAGFVGGAKATSGILGIIASERYPTKPRSAAPLQFGAAVAYAPGIAVALGVNLDIEIKREIAYQRNKKRNRLPRQILSSQLQKLDSMEASIRSLNQ